LAGERENPRLGRRCRSPSPSGSLTDNQASQPRYTNPGPTLVTKPTARKMLASGSTTLLAWSSPLPHLRNRSPHGSAVTPRLPVNARLRTLSCPPQTCEAPLDRLEASPDHPQKHLPLSMPRSDLRDKLPNYPTLPYPTPPSRHPPEVLAAQNNHARRSSPAHAVFPMAHGTAPQ
jgi:hypothetical protein